MISVDRNELAWLLHRVKQLPVSSSRDFYEEEMLERLEKQLKEPEVMETTHKEKMAARAANKKHKTERILDELQAVFVLAGAVKISHEEINSWTVEHLLHLLTNNNIEMKVALNN